MGERMAFPWELNLDRSYRDEKWPFPEQRARSDSTDSVIGDSAEKLDGFPVESENRQRTAEGSFRKTLPADCEESSDDLDVARLFETRHPVLQQLSD
jgi:hypothetical protein